MPLISGDRYFRDLIGGQKIIVTFEQQLISGGGGGRGGGRFGILRYAGMILLVLCVICRVAFRNKFLASSNSFLVRMLSLCN